MERYCETCEDFRSCHVENREETFSVRGEMTMVFGPVAICDVCGHIVSDEQLDGELLNSAYVVYRQRHGLLAPDTD